MNNFEYFQPQTIEEAVSLVSSFKQDCKIMAGGQSLLILMKMGLIAPGNLVDIKQINDLNYLKVEKKKRLRIGALTTHRKLEKFSELEGSLKVLSEMEQGLASVETRNWGTIGGSIAHADPAGDVLPVLIALDSTITIIGPKKERKISAQDFPVDYLQTALGYDELLKDICIPIPNERTGVAFDKFKYVEEDYATISTAVSIKLHKKKDICEAVRIVLGSVGPTAIRSEKAEAVLFGREPNRETLQEAGEVASKEINPFEDMHSSSEFKKEMIKVFVKRVGEKALNRIKMN
jgi:aerobic carbon-monoxide dehydrogenase medium subunit